MGALLSTAAELLPYDPPPYPPPQGGRERRIAAPIVMDPALHCRIDLTKVGIAAGFLGLCFLRMI